MQDLSKIALRLSLAETEALEVYEVVLERDLLDFENERTQSAVMGWPKEVQKNMQVGYQFVGRFTFHPVIIGAYAEIDFGAEVKPTPYITFLTSKFEKFESRIAEISRVKNITLSYARSGKDIYIPEYRCRVISDDLLIDVIRFEPLRRFFGFNMNVAICTTSAGALDYPT